ncbi:hypothetical protein [Dokdonella sp.]|uniref:hypothetical protein n=1 Tax=Dokdonella sp. TaxID=2291710 RepID=UPI001B2C62A6|nr:hypothetical protein [Dokdonella sp.]MBO9664074.1 hypothetical protein [Dokdonella sp.]
MKPRRLPILLLALLLVAAGIVGAVAPVLAVTAHHCDHADAGAPMPSAPCCGDCTNAPDCAQVCAPPFIAPSTPGQVVHGAHPAPADLAIASNSWTAPPQTRPPIA